MNLLKTTLRAAAVFVAVSLAACSSGDGDTTATNHIDVSSAVAYGDSTTQGDGVAIADRWTSLLAKQTGWPIDNLGANGQSAEEIAARWGSVISTGRPHDGLIPAYVPVSLTLDVDPLRSGLDTPTLEVDLRTDDGTLVRGVLSREGSERRFSRATPGATIRTNRVEVHPVVPAQSRQGVLMIGMGINNEEKLDTGMQTLEQLEAWYRGMTSLHKGRLIVWGMLDRGLPEAPGTLRGNYIAELESWLSREYGTNFLPVRQYLSSQRALDDAAIVSTGFRPTPDDLVAVDAGCVPPSFRVAPSSAHLNELGHQLQARLFYRHMSSPQFRWVP